MSKVNFNETKSRSVMKAISWRIVCIAVGIIILWLITHSWEEVTLFIIAYNIVMIVIYVFHERFWNRIGWGKKKK